MYFYPLSFIRFLLAIGVLLFHYGTVYYPFTLSGLQTLIVNSSFRVSFFFFISGFILTLVYQQKGEALSALYFYKKRLTRILPVYWLAFFLTLLLVLFVKGAGPKGLVIVLHALGLQTWYPGYVLDLNYTTWSISVELFFYALFPFLLNGIKRVSPGKLASIALLVYVLQDIQHFIFVNDLSNNTKTMEEFISTFPLWHLSTFFIGMFTARIIALDTFPHVLRDHSVALFFSVLLIFAYILLAPNPLLKYIHNGLLSPLFMLLVLSLYYDRTWLARLLSWPPLSRLGDLSYGIFVFQYPVWIILTAVLPEPFTKTSVYFFGYVFMVMLVSFLVNRYFEKPLLMKLRHKYKLS